MKTVTVTGAARPPATTSNCSNNSSMNPHRPIAVTALASRAFLLLAMSSSCAFLPDFDPGDDVLQFDLRLTKKPGDSPCFCLRRHACSPSTFLYNERKTDNVSCADIEANKRVSFFDGFYKFLLPPVTKWDSARFLTLAVDPSARYPNWNDTQSTTSDLTRQNKVTSSHYDKIIFGSSEQSHAFLPFFPLCIRWMSRVLVFILPGCILPSTYEATAALSAILINIVAFIAAAVALYELTMYLLLGEKLLARNRGQIMQKGDVDRVTNSTHKHEIKSISTLAALAFCLNPAGVFFTAAYSESIFAMLTFSGHAIAARGRYICWKVTVQPRDISNNEIIFAKWYAIPTNVLWALASYTRSNGVLSTTMWWFFIGVGTACLQCRNNTATPRARIVRCIFELLYHFLMGILVLIPVQIHDYHGYNIHCMPQSGTRRPKWCEHSSSKFSLYAYVQREHWNVGLFRYYELKQIPNFILAAPVLVLSSWAAARWIRRSLSRHKIALVRSFSDRTGNIVRWSYLALGSSAMVTNKGTVRASTHFLPEKDDTGLLLGASLLPYYAILFGFVLVGLLLAHVQISTRLICSSCPAFYWFIALLYIENNQLIRNVPVRWLLCFYFVLYNLLGAIMHVNWLPWT